MEVLKKSDQLEIISDHAAGLALAEVGLGSIIHGLQIPFGGHLLSVNQSAVLTRALRELPRKSGARTIFQISLIVAVLKSLSPAGKRLTPMLAISFQGLLYSTALVFLGVNAFGMGIGIVLASLWGFIQPVMIYYLFFGKELFVAADFFQKQLGINFQWEWAFVFLGFLVVAKALISLFFCWKTFYGRKTSDKLIDLGSNLFQKKNMEKKNQTPWKGAFRDLLHPLFLICYGVTVAFLFMSYHDGAARIWMMLRPLGMGFCAFYFFRLLHMNWIRERLRTYGFTQFSDILDRTWDKISSKSRSIS